MWLEADSWSFEGLFTAFSFGCGGGNLDQKENLDSYSYIIIRVWLQWGKICYALHIFCWNKGSQNEWNQLYSSHESFRQWNENLVWSGWSDVLCPGGSRHTGWFICVEVNTAGRPQTRCDLHQGKYTAPQARSTLVPSAFLRIRSLKSAGVPATQSSPGILQRNQSQRLFSWTPDPIIEAGVPSSLALRFIRLSQRKQYPEYFTLHWIPSSPWGPQSL